MNTTKQKMYRGKWPYRVAQLWAEGNNKWVRDNAGRDYQLYLVIEPYDHNGEMAAIALDIERRWPEIGDDIRLWVMCGAATTRP